MHVPVNPANKAPNPSPATSNQEPDFMMYIRNMNINKISDNYVQGKSFNEQDQVEDKVPQEYEGLSPQ